MITSPVSEANAEFNFKLYLRERAVSSCRREYPCFEMSSLDLEVYQSLWQTHAEFGFVRMRNEDGNGSRPGRVEHGISRLRVSVLCGLLAERFEELDDGGSIIDGTLRSEVTQLALQESVQLGKDVAREDCALKNSFAKAL